MLSMFCGIMVMMVVCLVTGEDHGYCYARTKNPYLMFSVFTPYDHVRERKTAPVNVPQCRPLQFWLLSRHGTRYPDDRNIILMWELRSFQNQIINNHAILRRGALCTQDLENLRKWTPQTVSTLAFRLSIQGYNEIHDIAERLKTRFRTLLNNSYSPDLFEVRFTYAQRTTLSAFAFIEGMFGSTTQVKFPQPVSGDKLLKTFATCKAWMKRVNRRSTLKEMTRFENGQDMKTLIKAVSSRLGFNYELSIVNMDAMYAACRFEKSWHMKEISPWCAVFTEEELKVMEYREDLRFYHLLGHGSELNKFVGCPPAKDFLKRFRALESGKQEPSAVFYFTHDTMQQLFYTALGIAQDKVPLTHSNYREMENRKWRTSLLSPFAGNFAAVFFRCDVGEPYRVQFYLHEKLLHLEGCKEGLCNWSYIKEKYSSIYENCNPDAVC